MVVTPLKRIDPRVLAQWPEVMVCEEMAVCLHLNAIMEGKTDER